MTPHDYDNYFLVFDVHTFQLCGVLFTETQVAGSAASQDSGRVQLLEVYLILCHLHIYKCLIPE